MKHGEDRNLQRTDGAEAYKEYQEEEQTSKNTQMHLSVSLV